MDDETTFANLVPRFLFPRRWEPQGPAYHIKRFASNSFDSFLVSSNSDLENCRPPTMSLLSGDVPQNPWCLFLLESSLVSGILWPRPQRPLSRLWQWPTNNTIVVITTHPDSMMITNADNNGKRTYITSLNVLVDTVINDLLYFWDLYLNHSTCW